MSNLICEVIDTVEDYFISKIFRIREDEEIRNCVKLTELENIARSASALKLHVAEQMAVNSILIVLGEDNENQES